MKPILPNLLKKQTIQGFDLNESAIPSYLRKKLAGFPHSKLWSIGNLAILKAPLVGLFCSIRCPGNVILQTYDLARGLREAGIPVIGGFHSPMEKECLDLLLRGQQPVVVCPARSLAKMRIPKGWREPLAEGRLLVLSPFDVQHKRATATLGVERNRLVSLLASEFFIPFGAPGSKTELLCRDLVKVGKPIYTFLMEETEVLTRAGAKPVKTGVFLKKFNKKKNMTIIKIY